MTRTCACKSTLWNETSVYKSLSTSETSEIKPVLSFLFTENMHPIHFSRDIKTEIKPYATNTLRLDRWKFSGIPEDFYIFLQLSPINSVTFFRIGLLQKQRQTHRSFSMHCCRTSTATGDRRVSYAPWCQHIAGITTPCKPRYVRSWLCFWRGENVVLQYICLHLLGDSCNIEIRRESHNSRDWLKHGVFLLFQEHQNSCKFPVQNDLFTHTWMFLTFLHSGVTRESGTRVLKAFLLILQFQAASSFSIQGFGQSVPYAELRVSKKCRLVFCFCR